MFVKSRISVCTIALIAVGLPQFVLSAPQEQADKSTGGASSPSSSGLTSAPSDQLTLGAFDFHPRVRSGVLLDDNILFSARNTQSDAVWQVAPGLEIFGGDRSTLNSYRSTDSSFDPNTISSSWLVVRPDEYWPGKFVSADYSPRWNWYTHHSVNDSIDQFLTANAIWPMSKLTLGFRQDFVDEKTVLEYALSLNRIRRYRSEVNAGYRFSDKFSADTAFSIEDVNYPDSRALTGYTEYKDTLNLTWEAGEQTHIGLLAEAGWDDVSRLGSVEMGQQFERFGPRLRYDYSTLLSFDGSLGVEMRQFDSGRDSATTPFLSLGASYRAWERGTFRALIGRQVYGSLANGYYYTSTSAGVQYRQGITDRFTLGTELNYVQADSISSIKNNLPKSLSEYYSFRLNGEVKLVKALSMNLYYQFRGSGLFKSGDNIDDNQLGLELNLRY